MPVSLSVYGLFGQADQVNPPDLNNLLHAYGVALAWLYRPKRRPADLIVVTLTGPQAEADAVASQWRSGTAVVRFALRAARERPWDGRTITPAPVWFPKAGTLAVGCPCKRRPDLVGWRVAVPMPTQNPQARPRPTKPKTGPVRKKLINALLRHHGFAEGKAACFDAVKLSVLARKAGVSTGAVSNFFRREFGSHKAYRDACRAAQHGNDRLTPALSLLAGSFKPASLFRQSPSSGREN